MTPKIGDITLAKSWVNTPRIAARPGCKMGYELRQTSRSSRPMRVAVFSVGRIQIGTQVLYLGVSEGSRRFFLADTNGRRLWKHPDCRLPEPAVNARMFQRDSPELDAWADSMRRVFCAFVVPAPDLEHTQEMVRRYGELVAALVTDRVLLAAAAGVRKSPLDYAHACSESWTALDLRPNTPTLMHALTVALALALEHDKAKHLIMLGGLIEYRVSIITDEVALSLYRQGTRVLGAACPDWQAYGYNTNWSLIGSIERIFTGQWAMLLRSQWGRGLTAATPAAGDIGVYPAEANLYVESDELDDEIAQTED